MQNNIYCNILVCLTVEGPGDYLQRVLFPVLLPGLEAMLRKAKETEVRFVYIASSPLGIVVGVANVDAWFYVSFILAYLQRRRLFNPLNFLCEYLYRLDSTDVCGVVCMYTAFMYGNDQCVHAHALCHVCLCMWIMSVFG